VLLVGLTGGIGAGKSTLAALLAERGAQIIDADLFARDALRPGEPAWNLVVEHFGDEILSAGSMEIDRKRLASIVFADPKKRIALNGMVHPVVLRRIADELEGLSATEEIVVLDAPLLIETGLDKDLEFVVVVTARAETRESRLVLERGMSRADVHARIASQAPDSELVAKADLVIRNDGDVEALSAEADRVWLALTQLRDAK
jgi:dephospho-CoA kinase